MYFYYSYTGNKRLEFKYIKEILEKKKYNKFIEPFCGSCSTSVMNFYINNKQDIEYILNDISEPHIEFLRDIKERGCKDYFEYINSITTREDYDKELFTNIIKNKDYSLYDYFFYNKIYRQFKGRYNDEFKNKTYDYKKCEKLDNFFMNECVRLYSKDYMEIMDKYKNDADAFIYLDPPYLESFNEEYPDKSNLFKLHEYLYEYLKECKCSVILIMNGHPLINICYKDYIIGRYDKLYQYTKKKAEHIIISNINICS